MVFYEEALEQGKGQGWESLLNVPSHRVAPDGDKMSGMEIRPMMAKNMKQMWSNIGWSSFEMMAMAAVKKGFFCATSVFLRTVIQQSCFEGSVAE